MFKPTRSFIYAAAVAALLVAGTTPSFADVYVGVAPPALRMEVAPPPPPGPPGIWVWRPGLWRWHGVRYVWLHGRYVHPHHAGAAWIPGHWDSTPRGWVWVEGHWR